MMDESVSRMPICVCGYNVDVNDPNTPFIIVDRAPYHARCAAEEELEEDPPFVPIALRVPALEREMERP